MIVFVAFKTCCCNALLLRSPDVIRICIAAATDKAVMICPYNIAARFLMWDDKICPSIIYYFLQNSREFYLIVFEKTAGRL